MKQLHLDLGRVARAHFIAIVALTGCQPSELARGEGCRDTMEFMPVNGTAKLSCEPGSEMRIEERDVSHDRITCRCPRPADAGAE